MIIDCHTHIFPEEVRKDREVFCKQDKGFSSIYKNSKARLIGVEELMTSMNEWGIDRSVICGFPWSQADLCFLHNQYLLEAASRYPNRLIVFVMLLFSNPDWSEKELVRAMQGGARGVGEIAFYHYKMTTRDIHFMNPILSQMEKQGIPLLLHLVMAAIMGLYFLGVNELVLLFGGGLVVMLISNIHKLRAPMAGVLLLPLSEAAIKAAASIAEAIPFSVPLMFLTFLKIGSVLYGSGYVLLVLRADFVAQYGWLTTLS